MIVTILSMLTTLLAIRGRTAVIPSPPENVRVLGSNKLSGPRGVHPPTPISVTRSSEINKIDFVHACHAQISRARTTRIARWKGNA